MDVSDWRKRIDDVDLQILALLNQRAEFVVQLAALKQRDEIPVYEPDREAAVHENLRANNRGPLSHQALTAIFEAVMREMRNLQSELRHEAVESRRNE